MAAERPIRILIINPNSNRSMTESLQLPIQSLGYNMTIYTYYTAPSGPPSINSPHDALLSAQAALPSLVPLIPHHDAFLVACYSPHPLVSALKVRTRKPTIGIFEASIAAAIQLLPIQKSYPKQNAHDPGEYVKTADQEEHAQHGMTKEAKEETSTFAKFGIVSTGAIWKEVLTTAIQSSHPGMLGSLAFGLFAGVETIGLDAGDLHPPSPPSSPPLPTTAPSYSSTTTTSVPTAPQTIEQKVRSAARRLLQAGDVGVVVLGCAGMVGMDTWVRAEMEGCIGKAGRVIDGVKAGVGILQGLVRTFED